jgi:hypothetical protein
MIFARKVLSQEISTERSVRRAEKAEARRRPGSTRAIAGRIDLHQAVCGLDQTPLRAYPAAQREILGQHFFCAFEGELGPLDALLGISHRASLGFHGVHRVHRDLLTHSGPDRSLMPGETGASA